ncbi:MAG TPA: MFS transporter, partial [Blastocatellia bacterium]|nr:MFS transporter [Blastocatellia bacterium]
MRQQAGASVEAPGATERGFAFVFRALRYPNYRLFFGGQLISLIGTWMQTVAQSWLVYRLTGSAVLLGFVGFSSQIPVFMLAPFTGALVDRSNRRRIIIGTQTSAMLLAFVLAVLTLTGVVHVWHVFVLAALLGVVNALDIPARQVFIVEMVGREDMVNAIALNSSMFNGARIVGPAIAGALVSAIGEGWCFFANGISY